MTETYDGWGLTDSDYEPRLTHGIVDRDGLGDDGLAGWSDVAELVGLDPDYSPRHGRSQRIGHGVRVALLETDTVSGSVYVVDDYAVVRWTDYVAGDWAEAYTGTNRVAVAVARLAVLALPAIHGHGFVDDADGFAARVEPVLLESVGLSADDACPDCRGSGVVAVTGPAIRTTADGCDEPHPTETVTVWHACDEDGCVDGWTV
jgi:hypothetical protein